jgi:hypothetical protein
MGCPVYTGEGPFNLVVESECGTEPPILDYLAFSTMLCSVRASFSYAE